MAFFKWFAKIEASRVGDQALPQGPLEPFGFEALRPKGVVKKLKGRLTNFAFRTILPAILRLMQNVHPNIHLRFLNFAIVTRDDDVRQVLGDGESFGVPYGPEMHLLGNEVTFALGQDGPEHLRLNKIMREVIHTENDRDMLVTRTRRFCEGLIENGCGRIDVITDLITRIATETGARYFGVQVDDPKAFAEWSLAASCLLFGDPGGDALTRKVALNGGRRLCLAIDKSIRLSRDQGKFRGDSIIDRLVQRTDIEDPEIRATILGMITGFIPTNTLAAGKMLCELLRRPAVFTEACKRAVADDRDGVRKIIMEAARLDSALAPGQWRVARKDAVIAPGTSRKCAIPAGTIVLVSTMTALRDKRRFKSPSRFRTDRDVEGDLMFGGGPHACLGKHLAVEQITEIFMVLLAQPDLRPARGKLGKVDYIGAFPVRLDMTYRSPASEQNMVLVIAPVLSGASKAEVDAVMHTLGHPASEELRIALDETNLVHFASLATVQSDKRLDIIMELSLDGPVYEAIRSIAQHAGEMLRPIFLHAGIDGNQDIAEFMNRHVVRLHSKPWGATGLDFNGTAEFSVKQIRRELHLALMLEQILQENVARFIHNGRRPMEMIRHIRAVINGDFSAKAIAAIDIENNPGVFESLPPELRAMGHPITQSMTTFKLAHLDGFLMIPSRKQLAMTGFQEVTKPQAFVKFLKSTHGSIVVGPVLALFALMLAGLWSLIEPPAFFVGPCSIHWHIPPRIDGCNFGWPQTGLAVLATAQTLLGALLATLIALLVVVGSALLFLRFKEARDAVDTSQASVDHMRQIMAIEDHPGHLQNHVMAVGTLKDGIFRKLVHAFALWAVKMLLLFYSRPGFILNLGTIHYARWFRLPSTNRSVFFSNYNGSWESYLEDFITRMHLGQTAVWSNWKGFPRTRFLIGRGAKDGDQFKRWVRCQQQIVPFWYSGFPKRSIDHMRTNALIHYGLARAQSDDEAREWLRLFGSMPRVHNRIESDEVQSLVFSGQGKLQHSSYLILQLPADPQLRADWQKLILGEWVTLGPDQIDHPLINGVPIAGIQLGNRPGVRSGPGIHDFRLNPRYVIGFGDQLRPDETNMFFALSAEGLAKCSAGPDRKVDDIPHAFPPSFQMGMASRARVLGDTEDADPEKWYWSDIASEKSSAAEAVLVIYGNTAETADEASELQRNLLSRMGGQILDRIDSAQAERGFGFEHFGFRDGISQPTIRGTAAVKPDTPARDIIEPGEFILGYENSENFRPPSPTVRAEADIGNELPLAIAENLSAFPDFGAAEPASIRRDIGRNGTYLVLRELSQNVDGFDAYVAEKLNTIKGYMRGIGNEGDDSHLEKMLGQRPTPEWFAAKMIGRWHDGRPLVRYPTAVDHPADYQWGSPTPEELANDFDYGSDDPQGLACPFGSHIRRANPRDSKQPGDPIEQTITNRHRLLRRGRTYARPASAEHGEEKGVMFACLCADIERQFEFVQQTWLNASSFHGLKVEPDPIVGTVVDTAVFTIPTVAGPIKINRDKDDGIERFVTVRGGGYFFLPSRSALLFLASL